MQSREVGLKTGPSDIEDALSYPYPLKQHGSPPDADSEIHGTADRRSPQRPAVSSVSRCLQVVDDVVRPEPGERASALSKPRPGFWSARAEIRLGRGAGTDSGDNSSDTESGGKVTVARSLTPSP